MTQSRDQRSVRLDDGYRLIEAATAYLDSSPQQNPQSSCNKETSHDNHRALPGVWEGMHPNV